MKILEALPPYRALLFTLAKRQILKQTKGLYPAPLEALKVIQKTFGKASMFNYDIEAQKVGEMIASDISKSLINLFQATEDVRKMPIDKDIPPVTKVGVLGAGIMGGGIAHLLASKNYWVRIKDIEPKSLLKALQTASGLVKKQLKKRRLSKPQAQEIMQHISPTTSYEGFSNCDFVIEAVVENMDIKKTVLQELASKVSPKTILATNTSALSITEMASVVPSPERVVGLHFFNPVHRMPLIEVVKGDQTSERTVQSAMKMAISLGKTPIKVLDRPGFLVNRILGLYLNESLRLLDDGESIFDVEVSMKKFGMPMGPFQLMDEVGLDVVHKVGDYLCSTLAHFPKPAHLFEGIIQSGRKGKKSGQGFYDHKGKSKPQFDTAFLKSLGINVQKATSDREALNSISSRLVYLMINEGFRCLDEKVVDSERDIDLGMVLGTGFAPFRGGLMAFADKEGLLKISETLEAHSKTHGEHFKPCALLIKESRQG